MPVNLRTLLVSYENNEVSADAQYLNKLVQVTGVVDDIKKDILGNPFVTISAEGEELEFPEFQASFDSSQASMLAELIHGEKVTLVCKITGLMFNVQGNNCHVRSVYGPNNQELRLDQ